MPYASAQDLIDRYRLDEIVQLTNQMGGSTIDAEVLGRALADADSTVNAYLQGRYALPLPSPYPALLVRLGCEITRYYLYKDAATDQVKERHDAAIATLEGIAKGRVGLGLDAVGQEAPDDAAGNVLALSPPRVFSRETLERY